MYHIKDDQRSKNSAITIYRSIRHLARIKSLSNITITDIKNECGISRSSFYRNFDNIIDPLKMKLDEFVDEYLKNVSNKKNHLLYFFEYWQDHKEFITLLHSEGYNNLIIESFEKRIEHNNDYEVSVRVAVMASLLSSWVKNNNKETPAEMTKIAQDIINNKRLLF